MKYKLITIALVLIVITIGFVAQSRFFIDGPQKEEYVFYHEDNKCSSKESEFCTHLPLVSIDTDGQEIPGSDYEDGSILSSVKIVDNAKGGNHLKDKADLKTDANIHVRGFSSREFDKKGYLLKFVNDDGSENKQKVMGMEKHDEWVLHGPFIDKTLMRNYLWYHIAGEIMDDAPKSRFCEVFINGEYKGVYLMVEAASRGDSSRMQIKKYKDGDPYTSYIVRLDRTDPTEWGNLNNLTRYTYRIGNVKINYSIVYPGQDKITDELKNYIEKDMTKFEKRLYSYDYDSHLYGYETFLNVDSFVDYFIINEFTQNYDAGNLSTYLYKDVKGKYGIYVWDFNSANDNYEQATPTDTFSLYGTNWFFMIMKDEDFTNKIIQKYKYLRNHALNEKYLLNYIDAIVDYLGPAIDRNFEVWGYTFEGFDVFLTDPKRNLASYDEAIDQLKNHIIDRGRFLDKYMVTVKQFSAEAKVKRYNH